MIKIPIKFHFLNQMPNGMVSFRYKFGTPENKSSQNLLFAYGNTTFMVINKIKTRSRSQKLVPNALNDEKL